MDLNVDYDQDSNDSGKNDVHDEVDDEDEDDDDVDDDDDKDEKNGVHHTMGRERGELIHSKAIWQSRDSIEWIYLNGVVNMIELNRTPPIERMGEAWW